MTRHPYLKLIFKNTFTLFNLVNVILAVMVALVGSYKNMLFIGVAIANTLISIASGVRAQKTVDKLKLLSEKPPLIERNGKPATTTLKDVKSGDLCILTLGDQVLFDSHVTEGVIEVNESFITGEQKSLTKRPGDLLTSGGFVVSGTAKAKVLHVGADNFVTKLQSEASTIKTADSHLFKLMNNIVKYISYALIPIGALLLWSRFRTEPDTATAVTSTVAALINMIPEGLILLTSSVLALATIRLGRQKVLVQDLYSIETLARVDTIALDKTGTLTTGKLTVHDLLLREKSFESALASILSHQTSENATISALKKKLARGPKIRELEDITEVIPFSSDRKYSGVKTGDAEYLMGAIEFLTDDKSLIAAVHAASGEYRTLAVIKRVQDDEISFSQGIRSAAARGKAPAARGDGPAGRAPREIYSSSQLLGLIRLEDELRPTARRIIDYFYKNSITPVIISGDSLDSVKTIAAKVGLKDLRAVDLSAQKSKNYQKLVENYAIFTRVTPSEKKSLISALKKQGKTVAMTGDGVNDILAMKEADVSLAIGEGSDAARRAAKLVLLNSGFEAVPAIIDEGRQSINNLERSTSLFLAKTVYASLLAVLFVVLPLSYPYSPIEMTLLNFLCIGFPGLILALEKNTARIKNLFLHNIKRYSVPTGLAVAIAAVALSIVAEVNNFPHNFLITLSAIVTFAINFALLVAIARPPSKFRVALLVVILALFLAALFLPFSRTIFDFSFSLI